MNESNKPRLTPFSVRFTPEERAQVEAQAGNMPLGSYIKTALLTQDAPSYRKRRKPPVKNQELLAQVLACLGSTRLASNLNQLAKATHIGTFYFDADAKIAILRTTNDVAMMRQLLMQAWVKNYQREKSHHPPVRARTFRAWARSRGNDPQRLSTFLRCSAGSASPQ